VVLKVTGRSLVIFAYGTITLYGFPFLQNSTNGQICNSFGSVQHPSRALQLRCHIGLHATE